MEEEDLYDDIFESAGGDRKQQDDSGNLDDLYENIHIPEVAESAISKAKVVDEENQKLKSQTAQLKKQISILSNINSELKTANTNLQKNLNSLVETSRIEINRKKNEISEIRKELDSVLRNRAAKNLSKREIEEVLQRARPKEDPYFECRLPVKPPSSLAPTKMQSGIRVLVEETKEEAKTVVNSKTPVAVTATNRQFVKKKRPPHLEKKTIRNVENSGKSIVVEGSAGQKNDISMISKYFGGRASNTSKTIRRQTGTAVVDKVLETNPVKELVKNQPQKNNNPVVEDEKDSIKPVFTENNEDANYSPPTAASELDSKSKENTSDESQEEPSDHKTTEISPGQESLSTSAVCKDRRLTPSLSTAGHLEKCDRTSKIGNSTEDVQQAIPSEVMAKDIITTKDVEKERQENQEVELEQKDEKKNAVEGSVSLLKEGLAISAKRGNIEEAQMIQQDVDPTGPEDVISFAINSEDELDYEAEEDTEEEGEPSKVEEKKPFVIPKVDKAKSTSSQSNDLQKRGTVALPGKVADSRRSSEPKTNSDSKYRDKGQKDEKRYLKSGPPTSRSRSPHKNRKRSRSRSGNRVEIPTKTDVGCRVRGGRGGEVKSRQNGRRNEDRSSEQRCRKERERERSPKKDTLSREKVSRSRCEEDNWKDKKGNKSEKRNKQVDPDRNGRTLRIQTPKSKRRKSESKLEELDDEDLLRLRKELLKQMKAEDLEKLEAANENVEDGEISDSNDDEANESVQCKKASFDLRAKLKKRSSDPKESSANKNKDTGSDKENSTQKGRGTIKPLSKRTSQDDKEVLQDNVATKKGSKHGIERNKVDDQKVKGAVRERKGDKIKDTNAIEGEESEEGMRPELLLGFSIEDIDHKLIPFKKRQFKQLQFEEIQLKVSSIKHEFFFLYSTSTNIFGLLTLHQHQDKCLSGPDCCKECFLHPSAQSQ